MRQYVFLDECGVTTDLLRLYGRSPRGTRLTDHTPGSHWQTHTVIAALRLDGLGAPAVFDGPIDSPSFLADIEHVLVPTLRPGDVVVLDNLVVHKQPEVQAVVFAFGEDLAAFTQAGGIAQVKAIGIFANGTTRDVTVTCTLWASDDLLVLSVNSAGLMTAQSSSGSATITTTCQGVSARGLVTVNLAGELGPAFLPRIRIGATCTDGWASSATGSGACSDHGGVRCWVYSDRTCTLP